MVENKNYKNCVEDSSVNSEKQTISDEVKIIAQEIKIVQSLACNDVNKRNRQMQKLKKWLKLRSTSSFPFTEEDFMRLSKGLFYMMWMSDKLLVQEELAEEIGQLLRCFNNNIKSSIGFFGAFMRMMCQEWFGLDQWRIDKFMMLARRLLRYMFMELKKHNWLKENIQYFNDVMEKTVLSSSLPIAGLTMHILDIFFEELAKVANGDISGQQVDAFISAFVKFVATNDDPKVVSHCRTRVFYHLLYQSGLGREYSEKYDAWQNMGFPTSSINDIEKMDYSETYAGDSSEVCEQQTQQNNLDPRAGNVDVFIPVLPFHANAIIKSLEHLICAGDLTTKRRKSLRKLMNLFKTYQNGEFPLGIKRMPRLKLKSEKPLIKDKIEHLENLENEMYSTTRKLKQLNKRKRRKLLNSLNFEAANDENDMEKMIEAALPAGYLKAKRIRKRKALINDWIEEEIENIDDVVPKKKEKKVEDVVGLKTHENNENICNDKMEKNVLKPKIKRKESIIDISPIPMQEAKIKNKSTESGEWEEPLKDGEIEFFVPSRKLRVNKANANLVRNPAFNSFLLSEGAHVKESLVLSSLGTPKTMKRVKIMLKNNRVHKPSEYLHQIRSSPNIPYDASRKPSKGLLKPNLTPSPINPFFQRKLGIKLSNNSF